MSKVNRNHIIVIIRIFVWQKKKRNYFIFNMTKNTHWKIVVLINKKKKNEEEVNS